MTSEKGNKIPRRDEGTEKEPEKVYVIVQSEKEMFRPGNGKSTVLYSQANKPPSSPTTSIVPSWKLPIGLLEKVGKLDDVENFVYADEDTACDIMMILGDHDHDGSGDEDEEDRQLRQDATQVIDLLLTDTELEGEELFQMAPDDLSGCIFDALKERLRLSETVEEMMEHEVEKLSGEDLRDDIVFHFVNVIKYSTVATE